MLGEIISAASDVDYYEYVRKNIFEPAGMKDSDWFEADAVVANLAEGYTRQFDEPEEQKEVEQQTPDQKPAQPAAQKLNTGQHQLISQKEATQNSDLDDNPKQEKTSPASVKRMDNNDNQKNDSSITVKTEQPEAEKQEKMKEKKFNSDINSNQNPGLSKEQSSRPEAVSWRRNIYTRPARGSAAGGGYATAEDLLRFVRALYECQLLDEAWTNWVFSAIEPQKTNSPNKEDRRYWSLAIAGGAPGINAVLEFDGQTAYTIIVMANYDPSAAGDMARMARRYLKAVKN